MFRLFDDKKNKHSWFDWNDMDKQPGWGSYDGNQDADFFAREPERDHFQDWLDLNWAYGDPDFDPLKPL